MTVNSADHRTADLAAPAELNDFIAAVTSLHGPDIVTVETLIEYDDHRGNRFDHLTLRGRNGETLGVTTDPDLAARFAALYRAQCLEPHVYHTFAVDLTTHSCVSSCPDYRSAVTPLAAVSGWEAAAGSWRD